MKNGINEVYSYLKQFKELYGCDIIIDLDKSSNSYYQKNAFYNKKKSINSFENEINHCQKCYIAHDRTNFVFGTGDPDADLFIVGEAPGRQEDLHGVPFIGQAGKLLDKILSAIGKSRKKGVYIANILKCRPPKNRDPLQSEIDECIPYLKQQINTIKPKLILALGKVAAKVLINSDVILKEMRNTTYIYENIPLRITYHPAALLRNTNLKKPTWEDFKYVKKYLDQV